MVQVAVLSVDALTDHEKWSSDIAETQGEAPNFPIIADPDKKVADLYDMIHPNASDTATAARVEAGATNGIAIGRNASVAATGVNAIAIGSNSAATGVESVAIGFSSSATGRATCSSSR